MAHPVGRIARKLANRSGIESPVNATRRAITAISPKDATPCINLITSLKLADFLGLKVKTCNVK